MNELLTPVSVTRKGDEHVGLEPPRLAEATQTVGQPKTSSHLSSPEDALAALRQEPDYDTLVMTLRYLALESPKYSGFDVRKPSPLGAQLVQVLISDIAPNYWTLLKEDYPGPRRRQSSGLGLLLRCLRSVTGINACLLRMTALIRESKSRGDNGKPSDVSIALDTLLALLCAILEDDVRLSETWRSTIATFGDAIRKKSLQQELLVLVGGGRVVSLSAEAETIIRGSKRIAQDQDFWVADASKYTRWLGCNIVQWQLSRPSAEETRFCSELISKASRLGHFDTLVRLLLSRLLLDPGVEPSIFHSLFSSSSPPDQRKVLTSTLRYLSSEYLDRLGTCNSGESNSIISAAAGFLSTLVGPDRIVSDYLIAWLTRSSGAGLGEGVGIRRVVLSVVAQDMDGIAAVLEKSISQFGDVLYVKHSPILQQEVHAQVLLLSAGYVRRIAPIKLTLLMRSSAWLNAVSNRLGASNQRARYLGMIVGEALSGLVDQGDKKLDFDLDETKSKESNWYKSLVSVSDEAGSMNMLHRMKSNENEPQKTTTARPSVTKTPIAKQSPQGFIIEELSDDALGDDDDDLVPYRKPGSDSEDSDEDPTLVRRDKPKAPVYVRDLIRYLRDSENYEHQKLSITTAPVLIRRKAEYGTEVAEHAEELASLLVGLQDKYEMEDFDNLRIQGMIATIVAQPSVMGQWFAKTFFDGDYSLSQRASVLVVLGLGARELAGLETSVYIAASAFPSRRLPQSVEGLFLGPERRKQQPGSSPNLKPLPPNALDSVVQSLTSEIIAPLAATAADAATGPVALKLSKSNANFERQNQDDRIQVKTRAKPRIRSIPNKSAQLISTFFFAPLAARFQAALHAPASRLRGIVLHPYLLALFIKTLALLIHAAGPSTLSLPAMTTELWRVVLSIRARAAGELAVTRALLFALLTILDVNENRMRDLCTELGAEIFETQEWTATVFAGLRGGDDGGEEEEVKMLAAAVLIRIRGEVEKYQLLLAGNLIGFG